MVSRTPLPVSTSAAAGGAGGAGGADGADGADVNESSDLSRQYETPLGLAHTTMQALKARIKQHYDLASDYYVSLWGEHIHHGYWPADDPSKASDSKETAQANLIHLLLSISDLEAASSIAPVAATPAGQSGLAVLDVGCGVGGTSRFLASHLGCRVTGITISTRQVEIATRLSGGIVGGGSGGGEGDGTPALPGDAEPATTAKEKSSLPERPPTPPYVPMGDAGAVRFLELDAEKMGDHFAAGTFDVVWISEALSHFPDKRLFFRNARRLLKPGSAGKLVLADWFKADGLSGETFDRDIKPIEDGMLLPPLCTQAEYVQMATDAGLRVHAAPKDISEDVKRTWDLSWELVQKPSLWAFALSQGRDGIAFLQAFRAMRRGYGNGSFRYAVMCFTT